MNEIIQELITILDKELALYRRLLHLLREEKKIMVDYSIDDLGRSNMEKETIGLKLRLLEESRMMLMQRLSPHFDKEPEEITLADLCAKAGEPMASEIDARRTALKAQIGEVRELNERNRALALHSLSHIQGMINLIRALNAGSPTYEPTGTIKSPENRPGRVVRQEL